VVARGAGDGTGGEVDGDATRCFEVDGEFERPGSSLQAVVGEPAPT